MLQSKYKNYNVNNNITITPNKNMDLVQNSQVSASKKSLALTKLTCNWQLKLVNSLSVHGTLMYLNLTFMN